MFNVHGLLEGEKSRPIHPDVFLPNEYLPQKRLLVQTHPSAFLAQSKLSSLIPYAGFDHPRR